MPTGPPTSVTMFSTMGKMEGERIPIVGHIITDEDAGALQVSEKTDLFYFRLWKMIMPIK
jgi:hypothetical protein